jgi:hypothetical protein
VPPRPVEPIQPAMTYDFKNFRFETKEFQPSIKPLRLKAEELQKVNGGYVSAGFGNFASPFLSASITSKRSAEKFYGANFLHHSFGSGPVGGKNSASGMTNLNLFTSGYNEKLAGGLQANYENRITHFYGYRPTTSEIKRDTIRQQFNIVSVAGQFSNVKPADFNFLMKGEFSYLDDYRRASESDAGVKFESNYKIKDDQKFQLLSDFHLIARKDTLIEAKPRALFRVAPAYNFVPVKGLMISAGARFVYENDTIGTRPIHFYPDLNASYELSKSVAAFAALVGDIDRVSLHTLSRENMWVNSNILIFHSNKTFDLKAGIKGTVGSSFSFQAGADVSTWKHLYFFRNNVVRQEKFDVVYDNATISNFFAEWGVATGKRLSITMRGDAFQYSMNKEKEAWHRPTYRVSVFSHYNIYDKISIHANFGAAGGMKAFESATQKVVELKPAIDLNLKLRYFVSKNFSCYVEGNNLLNSDYPLYLHYPVRGLQVSGGVSWSF